MSKQWFFGDIQKFSSSKWQSSIMLAVLLLLLTASHVQAETPYVHLRPVAPGGIVIDWEHSFDGAEAITIEREDPAHTWVFTALNHSFTDMGLQPSRVYRYRVCAVYAQTLDCTPWLATQTLATPPPYSPPAVPSFTSSSSTPDSITVNWASSASYSFHQVRWAENGYGDGQNRVNGRSFTADRLRPGTYHFSVQGCNETLFGSSCSRFSAPIEVSTAPPPQPAAAKGIIYAVQANGDLMWFRHVGREDGSFTWEGPKTVGTGWGELKQVFSGGDGIIYGVTPIVQPNVQIHERTPRPSGGDLMWFRHVGREDGSFTWEGPKKVGIGWGELKQVFSGGNGILYAVQANGDLMWFRHVGREDGSFRWEGPKKVGIGWGELKQVFSGGNGILYAVQANGDLMWFRHVGREDGSFRWEGSEEGRHWVGRTQTCVLRR